MWRYSLAGIVTGAVVLLLSGCATTPGAFPTGAPSVSPPSAEASPTPEPLVTPVVAFEGDCSRMADAASLAAAMGTDVGPSAEVLPAGVRTSGGLDCWWETPDGGSIVAYAYPQDLVSAPIQARYEAPVCENYLYDYLGCRVAIADESMWMLISVSHFAMGDPADSEAAADERALGRLEAVLPVFEAAMADAAAPVAATRTASWWEPVDCESLGSRLPLADILGIAEPRFGYPSHSLEDVVTDIAEENGTLLECPWYGEADGSGIRAVWFSIYPGSGWDWPAFAAGEDRTGAEGTGSDLGAVEVAGAAAAVAGVGALTSDGSYLVATDGVNVVRVRQAPDAVAAAEAVLAALATHP